jgi:hypothetical protein
MVRITASAAQAAQVAQVAQAAQAAQPPQAHVADLVASKPPQLVDHRLQGGGLVARPAGDKLLEGGAKAAQGHTGTHLHAGVCHLDLQEKGGSGPQAVQSVPGWKRVVCCSHQGNGAAHVAVWILQAGVPTPHHTALVPGTPAQQRSSTLAGAPCTRDPAHLVQLRHRLRRHQHLVARVLELHLYAHLRVACHQASLWVGHLEGQQLGQAGGAVPAGLAAWGEEEKRGRRG